MSLLLSEESMIPSPSAASGNEKKTEAKPSLAQQIAQAVEAASRQVDEVRGQTIALRTDIARTTTDLKKTIIVTGGVVVLAIVFALGFALARLPSGSVADAGVVAAPEQGDDRATAELRTAVEELRGMVKHLMDRPVPAATPNSAERPATALADCSKLAADAPAISVDFSIPFQVGSANLSKADEATLDNVAKLLALAPDRCVLVEGHADITGKEEKNIALSLKRATAVVDYLAGKGGIERRRLVPLGKGSSGIAAGMDPADPQNRRVLFKVVTG